MSLHLFATFALLLCPLAQCAPDDYTSLMQLNQKLAAAPKDLGPISSSDRMSLGKEFTCAFSAEYIACWGDNSYGQLGDGSTTSINTPPSSFITISSKAGATGAYHTCIISNATGTNNGKVACWGRNNKGQLGTGATDNLDAPSTSFVDLGAGVTAKAIAAGDEHTCAICNNNQLKCWGNGANGRLGNGGSSVVGNGQNEMGGHLGYVSMGTGRTVIGVTAGAAHTCALLDNNQVKCFGMNTDGQLGYGAWYAQDRGFTNNQMGDSLPAVSLGSGVTVKSVVAGGNHTCAITNNDKLKCWGQNNEGQLGLENTAALPKIGVDSTQMGDNLNYVNLGNKQGGSVPFVVKSVTLGGLHTCAILGDVSGQDDRTKCWGNNLNGQLGYENTMRLGDIPGEMGVYLGGVSLGLNLYAVSLDAGSSHTCAILDNGDMKCWGKNNQGQLGAGSSDTLGNDSDEMGNNLAKVTPAPSLLQSYP